MADWKGVVSKSRIGNHAMNLLTSVATYREDDDTVGPSRPCFLDKRTDGSRTIARLYLSAIVLEVLSARM